MITSAYLTGLLSTVRFSFSSEDELQRGIAEVLGRNAIAHQREHRLSSVDRIDFFLPDDGIGIEVKCDGSTADLVRQVNRYVQHDDVRALLVVASRIRLANMPEQINGKPVRVVTITQGIA